MLTLYLPMKAPRLLAENVEALLKSKNLKQTDLAKWCRKSDVWVSQFFAGQRKWTLDDLDRVADMFGLATYQLFQPGIARSTERRSSLDRRVGRERRISHAHRQVTEIAKGIKSEPSVEPTTQELLLLKMLRQNHAIAAGVRQIVRAAPLAVSTPKTRTRSKPAKPAM